MTQISGTMEFYRFGHFNTFGIAFAGRNFRKEKTRCNVKKRHMGFLSEEEKQAIKDKEKQRRAHIVS
ncbi:hypothetical protein T265_05548 [Opisthorchis viverrini]|uniref:Uncharacterized protein n=1 Tax=Opisthorchis viverrini TaxID=6198 RepID=A0A075AF51_OPIVI|nr:hypothetical protein T265_05548 [Opisthorchis viverrini]KER27369.1 hypothetical protein T265_05548 [Opisthorchis viverrini]